MSERAYTVGEMDALREAIEHKWLFGSYGRMGNCSSRPYSEPEKTQCVEALVRTHMLAGHTADDLYASERPAANPEAKP
jgi:hypothetical protein